MDSKFHRFVDKGMNIFSNIIATLLCICLSIWAINFWITGTGTVDDSLVVLVLAYILLATIVIGIPIGFIFFVISVILGINEIYNIYKKEK